MTVDLSVIYNAHIDPRRPTEPEGRGRTSARANVLLGAEGSTLSEKIKSSGRTTGSVSSITRCRGTVAVAIPPAARALRANSVQYIRL